MSSRDTIPTEAAPGRFPRTGKYRIQRGAGCINCGKCIQLCVYGVHSRRPDDIRRMAEPDFDRCMNCFACVQDCSAGVLSMDLNPTFEETGDALYTADCIASLVTQAETGTIPVFGSGYGGPFSGHGFDAMWTDMSEIVRPTRDGIHGRETISTHVDIGRHPIDVLDLRFDDDGNPITAIPPTIEIKLPILFDRMPFMPESGAVVGSICEAASRLGTLAIVDISWFGDVTLPPGNVVLDLGRQRLGAHRLASLAERGGVVELEVDDETPATIQALRDINPYLFLFVRVPVVPGFEDTVERLATGGAEVIHLDASPYAGGPDPRDRDLPAAIATAHSRLVECGVRDATTLVASGGITGAEHVAKSILLGADAVAIDLPPLVALECTVCKLCAHGEACPRELENFDVDWGRQRIVNLMASWRNQLLEVLGAMGLRDVSRMRGETGRAIARTDLDREVFEPLFGRPLEAGRAGDRPAESLAAVGQPAAVGGQPAAVGGTPATDEPATSAPTTLAGRGERT